MKNLSITDGSLTSDMEYMTQARIESECECEMKKVCKKACYLLMGKREEAEDAHRLINLIQS